MACFKRRIIYYLTRVQNCFRRTSSCSSHETLILGFPDDIIVEILSRLPTHSVLSCRLVCSNWLHLSCTPYILEKHLSNSTPLLLGCSLRRDTLWKDTDNNKIGVFLLEGFGMKSRFKKTYIKRVPINLYDEGFEDFYGSCNGFLLFKKRSSFFIYNPVTREIYQDCIDVGYHLLGFFFHPLEKDFKFLICSVDAHENMCHYYTYSLKTKAKRNLGCFAYFPLPYTGRAVSVGGTSFFWMVEFCDNGIYGWNCGKTIMTYNLMDEGLRVMPHPGVSCTSTNHDFISDDQMKSSTPGLIRCSMRKMHEQMRLLEMDGRLSLSNLFKKKIEVWVLKHPNYWIWERKYIFMFNQAPDFIHGRLPFEFEIYPSKDHPIAAYHDGKLLLNWCNKQGPFWFNLCLNTIRKMKMDTGSDPLTTYGDVYVTSHTSNFVSLKDLNIHG